MSTEQTSIESVEAALLSLIINSGDNDLFLHSNEILKPECFANPFHQRLYRYLQQMVTIQSITIDKTLIKAKIRQPEYKRQLEQILAEHSSVDNYGEYLRAIKEEFQHRKLKSVLLDATIKMQMEPETDPIALISNIEDNLLSIVSSNTSAFVTPNDVLPDILRIIQEGNVEAELKTPLADLNGMLYGIQPVYYIIAGRPSLGKTECALDWAIFNGLLGHKSLIFSLEMDRRSLTNRAISNIAEIPHFKLRKGELTHAEMQKLQNAYGTIREIPLHIDDTPGLNAQEIAARAKRFKIKHPDLKMVVIDYLQLVSEIGNGGNRDREISQMSQTFKNLNRTLGVPVIALSQLSRKVEERNDKRPMLSDLRDSGSIEQDADVVIFLYSENYYDLNRRSFNVWDTELIVAKHRNGPVGIVSAVNLKDFQKFEPAGGIRGDTKPNITDIIKPEPKEESINIT